MDTAVDGLGQDIQVGDKVVWMSSYGSYGKMPIYVVRGITAKRVALSNAERFKAYPDCRPTYAAHNVVLVINKLINDPMERDE
jgi:hypothetical protein